MIKLYGSIKMLLEYNTFLLFLIEINSFLLKYNENICFIIVLLLILQH